ncbi:MAG: aspartate/glutamate racemase family protein [Candidatus Aminicenantes bacterium]|nr:aspartate/glutamate racemase family protein [Candidatus Aminicenantes bacterium]
MKIIGMIGGMSWESTLEYYRMINERVKKKLGGLHSAECLLYSVDFAEIEKLQHAGDWEQATEMMVDAARRVERGGAGCLIICTNTMHKMADEVQDAVAVPLLHIADAAALKIAEKGIRKVGLLGTKFTMEQDFYAGRLKEKHDINVLIPNVKGRKTVHDVIYNELCLGNIREESASAFREVIRDLEQRGAEGIVLGCTEIPLLVKQKDYDLPLFDTTAIHAHYAVDYALNP